jgi:hypothetical protein
METGPVRTRVQMWDEMHEIDKLSPRWPHEVDVAVYVLEWCMGIGPPLSVLLKQTNDAMKRFSKENGSV